ncbi:hypothetical protein F4779DRAFT_124491 [Xylariaceae sp. FL0662B]|nr:hypothetical protein F4779DRAFT_124491 [Xylariaceae sp. FL0662B]
MDQPMGPQVRAQPKPKLNYACEACRAAKVRCQSGPQPGICKRCFDFKRECVFRTGPRTRRPKVSSKPDAEVLPPPPGPGKTFSIDFSMPSEPDADEALAALRAKHEQYIEDLVPSIEDPDGAGPPPLASSGEFDFNDLSVATPSTSSSSTMNGSSSINSRPMSSLGIKPQFNLDSAGKLLDSFRAMLPHCTCVVLPDDADVRSMARRAPFVLLAILAVTSCSTSLQGKSLYVSDEEFRKVLGLKFVMGGERSLELVQGLMIYCSWYPFHLRPKNRQFSQYLRMAADIVHDLELDQEADLDLASQPPERRSDKLQSIRAFLACYYGNSTYAWGWSKAPVLNYTPWVAKCAEALEHFSDLDQDHALVWLVRLQSITDGLSELQRSHRQRSDTTSHHQKNLMRIGLETQLRDFQSRIPSRLSTTPSIFTASLTTEMYLTAAPLMRAPRPRPDLDLDPPSEVAAALLLRATHAGRTFFDRAAALSAAELARLSGFDVTRLVLCLIAAFRLSFPVPTCPAYDWARGRRVLDLGAHLARLSADKGDSSGAGTGTGKADVVAALRVVLGSVRTRFERMSAALHARAEGERGGRGARACPMFDGSLDEYLPLWEGQQPQQEGTLAGSSYSDSTGMLSDPVSAALAAELDSAASSSSGAGSSGAKPMVFHDLWATMTMGWGSDITPAADTTELSDAELYADYVNL